jgi:hypothetical protein
MMMIPYHTRCVAVILGLLLAAPAVAGDRTTIEKNPFIPGQADVYRDGHRAATIEENPFIPGQFDVYDTQGHRTERIEKNPFLDDRWDVIHEPDHK